MPIYPPGKRSRKNKGLPRGRGIWGSLSLTPMVDMFTILVIFLLQNYNATGEVLYIPKDVQLPKASQIKELKPAHVVIVTSTDVILDKQTVAKMEQIKKQTDWMISSLRDSLRDALRQDEIVAKQAVSQKLSNVLPGAMRPSATPVPEESRRKVTVQADKSIDFLTMKKIMFTVTEAGASEINFAVLKKEQQAEFPPPGG